MDNRYNDVQNILETIKILEYTLNSNSCKVPICLMCLRWHFLPIVNPSHKKGKIVRHAHT